jgi:large subunit ribosomal protein L21
VIATGGKQYLVAEGDRLLVPRIDAEPGSEVAISRVLFANDGEKVEFGGDLRTNVTARVITHEKGPKVVAFRYKSKKHVRVHRGSRAALTTIEIVRVGAGESKRRQAEPEAKPETAKPRARAAATRSRKPRAEEETDGS